MDDEIVEDAVVLTGIISPEAERDGQGQDAPGAQTPEYRERLKLQLGAWVDEYKALRTEITALGTASRQATQVAIVALAAQVSLAGYIVQNDLPILFLLAPFIFYALAWTQLRIVYISQSISDYILKNITKGVGWSFEEMSACSYPPPRLVPANGFLPHSPLEWDEVARHAMQSHRKRLWLIEASPFVVPLVVAALLPGAYFSYTLHLHAPISGYATVYLLLNECVFIYTVMMSSWMRRFRQGKHDKDEPRLTCWCDLLVPQLCHYLINSCKSLSVYAKALKENVHVSERSIEQSWYTKAVSPKWLLVYRILRLMLWFAIGVYTYHLIGQYNRGQVQYAAHHKTMLTLTSSQKITGILIGYDGKNYVMTVGGQRQEIDASLVKRLAPGPIP